MKHLILLTFILSIQYSFSQNEPKPLTTDYQYDINNNLMLLKKNNIIYKYKYNSKNLLIEKENVNGSKIIKEYKKGKIIKEYKLNSFETNFLYKKERLFKKTKKEFSSEKEFIYLTIYKYKKNGDTIYIKKYSDLKEKEKSSIKVFEYSKENNTYKTIDQQYHQGKYNTFITYFNNYRKKETLYFIENNKEKLREKYYYDENNNLIKLENIYLDYLYLFEYDENNNLIKQSHFEKSTNELIEVIKYEHDIKNRLISKKEYNYMPIGISM